MGKVRVEVELTEYELSLLIGALRLKAHESGRLQGFALHRQHRPPTIWDRLARKIGRAAEEARK